MTQLLAAAGLTLSALSLALVPWGMPWEPSVAALALSLAYAALVGLRPR